MTDHALSHADESIPLWASVLESNKTAWITTITRLEISIWWFFCVFSASLLFEFFISISSLGDTVEIVFITLGEIYH